MILSVANLLTQQSRKAHGIKETGSIISENPSIYGHLQPDLLENVRPVKTFPFNPASTSVAALLNSPVDASAIKGASVEESKGSALIVF